MVLDKYVCQMAYEGDIGAVKAWLAADPSRDVTDIFESGEGYTNEVNLLCLSAAGTPNEGKVALTAWLLLQGVAQDAQDALATFALERTELGLGKKKLQGVDTPSQQRYVHQIDALLRARAGRPVRVGIIGSGKFGSMFLAEHPAFGTVRRLGCRAIARFLAAVPVA